MTQSTDTIEREPETTTDKTQATETSSGENVPSWSELIGKTGTTVTKGGIVSYIGLSVVLIVGSMMFLPAVSFSGIIAVFLVSILAGLIGKGSFGNASVAGGIVGLIGAVLSGGLTAVITIMPLVVGLIGGMISGIVGTIGGSWIRGKLSRSD